MRADSGTDIKVIYKFPAMEGVDRLYMDVLGRDAKNRAHPFLRGANGGDLQ